MSKTASTWCLAAGLDSERYERRRSTTVVPADLRRWASQTPHAAQDTRSKGAYRQFDTIGTCDAIDIDQMCWRRHAIRHGRNKKLCPPARIATILRRDLAEYRDGFVHGSSENDIETVQVSSTQANHKSNVQGIAYISSCRGRIRSTSYCDALGRRNLHHFRQLFLRQRSSHEAIGIWHLQ